jgi:hypothetical protein
VFETKLDLIVRSGRWSFDDNSFSVSIPITGREFVIGSGRNCTRLIRKPELIANRTQIEVKFRQGKTRGNASREIGDPYAMFCARLSAVEHLRKKISDYEKLGLEAPRFGPMAFEAIGPRIENWLNNNNIYEDGQEEERGTLAAIKKLKTEISMKRFGIPPIMYRRIGAAFLMKNLSPEVVQTFVCHLQGIKLEEHSVGEELRKFGLSRKADDPFLLGLELAKYFIDKTDWATPLVAVPSTRLFAHLRRWCEKRKVDNNLLFVKVERPGHVFHPILPFWNALQNNCAISSKNLFFCRRENGFAKSLKRFQRPTPFRRQSQSNDILFIVHPENLYEEEMFLLKEFVVSRFSDIHNKSLPLVVVITSLECLYEGFSGDIVYSISDDDICHFCDFTGTNRKQVIGAVLSEFYLSYSNTAGAGKSKQIQDYIKRRGGDSSATRIFCDLTMASLPDFEEFDHFHLDLSPELFDNEFRFFDELWTLSIFGSFIKPDGSTVALSERKTIYFEVPTLTRNQLPDQKLRREDFPIAICDDLGSRKCFFDHPEKPFFALSPKMAAYARVFANSPRSVTDLLRKAFDVFFGKQPDDSLCSPRIVSKSLALLEAYLKLLPDPDESSGRIHYVLFLLTLRTVLHFCHLKRDHNKQQRSFVLLVPKNFFDHDPAGDWVLFCFSAAGRNDEIGGWNVDRLNQTVLSLGTDSNLNDASFCDFWKDELTQPRVWILRSTESRHCTPSEIAAAILGCISAHGTRSRSLRAFRAGALVTTLQSQRGVGWLGRDFGRYFRLIEHGHGRETYEAARRHSDNLPPWSQTEQDLYDYCHSRERGDTITDLSDLLKALAQVANSDNVARQLLSITFTPTFLRRFVILILHVVLRQPIMLRGFTGCGKTSVVNLLFNLIKTYGDDFRWRSESIDCHGNVRERDVVSRIENFTNSGGTGSIQFIVFFDELNTSPASCSMIDRMLNGEPGPNLDKPKNLSFIAAINPYVEVPELSRHLSRVGLKQVIPRVVSKLMMCKSSPSRESDLYENPDLNRLAYNVRELSDMSLFMVLDSDPESFEDTDADECQWMPDEESLTIRGIVDRYIRQWQAEKIFLDLRPCTVEWLSVCLHSLICEGFRFSRSFIKLRSVLSYRDVKRVLFHFYAFYHKLRSATNAVQRLGDAIVLSISLCMIYRFSKCTRIPVRNGRIDCSDVTLSELRALCRSANVEMSQNRHIPKDAQFITLNIRDALVNRLRNAITRAAEGTPVPTFPEDWCQRTLEYAWWKCSKYVGLHLRLFRLPSIFIHLFALSACYSVSKMKEFQTESLMTCLLIGMPGTSKTRAIELFLEHKQKRKDTVFASTFLST